MIVFRDSHFTLHWNFCWRLPSCNNPSF